MASEQPFVVSRIFADGHARYVLLMDDQYWHCSEWEFEMIMDKGHHPEEPRHDRIRQRRRSDRAFEWP